MRQKRRMEISRTNRKTHQKVKVLKMKSTAPTQRTNGNQDKMWERKMTMISSHKIYRKRVERCPTYLDEYQLKDEQTSG